MSAADDGPAPAIDGASGELARCRAEIERIDRAIVGLLGERLALGQQTAALKRAEGRPILDPQREAEVVRRAATLAREQGLPEELVREIFWRIVGLVRGAEMEKDLKAD